MSLKITAHSLDIRPNQKLDLPLGARLLTVNVDHRFNKCLLWTAQDEDSPMTEELTFTMAKLGDDVSGGEYVGTFKDNSGYVHVFAQRTKPAPIGAIPSGATAELLASAKTMQAIPRVLAEAVQ